jgi:hypothetical protein
VKENNVAKKLTLKKETLKKLSAEQLRKVAGGESDPGAALLLDAAESVVCNVL